MLWVRLILRLVCKDTLLLTLRQTKAGADDDPMNGRWSSPEEIGEGYHGRPIIIDEFSRDGRDDDK